MILKGASDPETMLRTTQNYRYSQIILNPNQYGGSLYINTEQ